jgi:hypothetical protein
MYISDTAPTGVPVGSMWWESDNGIFYVYYNDGDSIQWVQAAASPIDNTYFLLKAGGTMTGTLVLAANPVNLLDAAPKQYVDTSVSAGFTPSAGRLGASSATQLQFGMFNGGYIKINGIIYSIPGGGIVAANTGVYINGVVGNLAASTNYYVYVFNNAGVLTIDFSTTAAVTSTTPGNMGVRIKSGDDTRSLIGFIRTNASAQFSDGGSQRFVLSWFNQVDKTLNVGVGGGSTSSTSSVQIATAILESLTWANQAICVRLEGQGVTTGSYSLVSVGYNSPGSLIGNSQYVYGAGTLNVPVSCGGFGLLTEGYNYFMGSYAAASGSGTFTMNNVNLNGMTKG